MNLKHQGHMLGPEVFGGYQNVRKLTTEDIQFINELDAVGVGATRRRIAERIGQKTGNLYKAKDIQNKMVKLKRAMANAILAPCMLQLLGQKNITRDNGPSSTR